ncbi:hypothetical protein PEC69_14120 [Staphylococcus aureus]
MARPQQREIGFPISTNNASWGKEFETPISTNNASWRGPNKEAGGKSAYNNVQVGGAPT